MAGTAVTGAGGVTGAGVVSTAGVGRSPTVSFRKEPNRDALANTCMSERLCLFVSPIVTTATWNQDESDRHSSGPPLSPCDYRDGTIIVISDYRGNKHSK